jgi:acetylornithine deacetylase/succinyl-diaminopimelate desuccinylase-like protein
MTTRAVATPDAVDEEALIGLAQELVRCASRGRGEELERAFVILDRYLRNRGLCPEMIRVGERMPVLRCTVSAASGVGSRLLFEGHLDAVPEGNGWEFEPYCGELVDGMLRGRGSCDMKGGVAACAEAMCQLAARHERWSGSVTLLVVPDEETGSEQGLLPYLARYGVAGIDGAVCAEPTDLHPYLGNRGLIWARLRIAGQAAHAGMARHGSNPIPVAAEFIEKLADAEWSGEAPTPTTIHAGAEINTVPGEAVVGLDLRLNPGDDAQRSIAELQVQVEALRHRFPTHDMRLELDKVWPACVVDERSVLARAALCAARAVVPGARFGFDEAANDASFLSEAGVPTLVWGPGAPGLAHAPNEQVNVSQIVAASRMYTRFVGMMRSGGDT